MNTDDAIILLTAGTLATACGLLGPFLVLRRQSLTSDAIGHAVLPGVVAMYLLTGSRSSLLATLGAAAFGLLCVLAIDALRRTRLLGTDAAIALTFPALFSLGVLGVSGFASGAHLDLDSTIYGEITFAPFRTMSLGAVEFPRPLLMTLLAVLLALGFVLLSWRGLQTLAFDPEFADIAGLRGRLIQRLLLMVSAIVAVIVFDSVGAILVVTFFVVPAAAAQLVANRLDTMLLVSVAIGWVSSFVGQRAAVAYDSSIAGMIGLTTVGCFLLLRLLAPRRGLLWRWLRLARRRDNTGAPARTGADSAQPKNTSASA
ncbi:manganese/zinc/iron transport system permease protein [Tamaricihabitans halophyticus]|uniref:Manganese/zinc/iron transport system permease protein n=1 Tax=Tamaricihabitans halophyticus TaxID=1262583 RepID=A0A4R2R0B1_9PSEU|nr:metal ABC transporter permease [Tamaricihabitans halophyticus]TCP55124.1 manganese/zinc/iron transport system permease protein [Tamaricihabitans halophyticus]